LAVGRWPFSFNDGDFLLLRQTGSGFIAGTRKHRQSWVFPETVVRQRQLAHIEDRTPVRFDSPGVNAVFTKSCPRLGPRSFQRRCHSLRISAGYTRRSTGQILIHEPCCGDVACNVLPAWETSQATSLRFEPARDLTVLVAAQPILRLDLEAREQPRSPGDHG
jgi:hypothetical protein